MYTKSFQSNSFYHAVQLELSKDLSHVPQRNLPAFAPQLE